MLGHLRGNEDLPRRRPQHSTGTAEPPDIDKKGGYDTLYENEKPAKIILTVAGYLNSAGKNGTPG